MNVSTGGLVVSDFSFGAIAGSGYVSESSDRAQFVATSSNVALTVSYNNNINPSQMKRALEGVVRCMDFPEFIIENLFCESVQKKRDSTPSIHPS